MEENLEATINGLYELCTLSRNPASPQHFLDSASGKVAHLMKMEVALITSWEGRDEFSIVAGHNVPPDFLAMKRLKMHGCFCEWIVRNERPLVIPDTLADEQSAGHPISSHYNYRSYIGVPLISPIGKKGTLCLLDRRQALSMPEKNVKILTLLGALIQSQWENIVHGLK